MEIALTSLLQPNAAQNNPQLAKRVRITYPSTSHQPRFYKIKQKHKCQYSLYNHEIQMINKIFTGAYFGSNRNIYKIAYRCSINLLNLVGGIIVQENQIRFEKTLGNKGGSPGISIPAELCDYLGIEIGTELILIPDIGKHGKFIAIWKKEVNKPPKMKEEINENSISSKGGANEL